MRLHRIIREYFSFTKSERKGLLVLIVLIVVFMVANQVIFYFERQPLADIEKFEQLLSEIPSEVKTPEKRLSLFLFDPNTIGPGALDSLDLPEKVKKNLLNYRSHKGVFRKKDDFRKIYGVTDSIYDVISHFLYVNDIPAERKRKKKRRMKEKTEKTVPVSKKEELVVPSNYPEINKAKLNDLKMIKGIGDVYAKRILKYRNLLGGFYDLKQLNEVYGLPDELIKKLEAELALDSSSIRQININFAGFDEFSAHPYLSAHDASVIINYRGRHGFIDDKNRLLKDAVLDEATFMKVTPYLKTKN